jgi:hypothetical protein
MVKEAKQKRDLCVWLCLRWKYLENINPASQPFTAQTTVNPKTVSSAHTHKLYFHAKRQERHEVLHAKRQERHEVLHAKRREQHEVPPDTDF